MYRYWSIVLGKKDPLLRNIRAAFSPWNLHSKRAGKVPEISRRARHSRAPLLTGFKSAPNYFPPIRRDFFALFANWCSIFYLPLPMQIHRRLLARIKTSCLLCKEINFPRQLRPVVTSCINPYKSHYFFRKYDRHIWDLSCQINEVLRAEIFWKILRKPVI